MFDPLSSDLSGLAAALEAGICSSRFLTEWFLDRIHQMDQALRAFAFVDESAALKLADAADSRRAAGYRLGFLDGLPLAVKDLCDIEGRVTAAGSRVWSDRRAQRTAPVIRHLVAAGMVIVGKTQMVEFAFGGWGVNPHLGTPLNPWDLEQPRMPGGSSSGSAVAVAAGLVPAALGSDTGGSIRIPASVNGITGLKTSLGLIDLTGTVPLSSTLDTLGFLARTAEDTLLLSQAVCSSSHSSPLPALQNADNKPLAGIRIATVAPTDWPVLVHDEVRRVTLDAECSFRALGAQVERTDIPFNFAHLMTANSIITAAEAYALHRDYIEDDSLPFGSGVRCRILSGKEISTPAYIEALNEHREMQLTWRRWSRKWHALLTPCLADPPLPLTAIGEDLSTPGIFTRAGNFIDATGLALPAGFCSQGLPIGVQLLGAPASQSLLVAIGAAFQRASDWHLRRPDLRRLEAEISSCAPSVPYKKTSTPFSVPDRSPSSSKF